MGLIRYNDSIRGKGKGERKKLNLSPDSGVDNTIKPAIIDESLEPDTFWNQNELWFFPVFHFGGFCDGYSRSVGYVQCRICQVSL